MQGYWTNGTYTPLERPAEFGTKEFFTREEALAYAKRRDDQLRAQPRDNIHYDDAIWQGEREVKGLTSLRTSLIYDPPDGRIPPLNAEGQRRAEARAAARKLMRAGRYRAGARARRAVHHVARTRDRRCCPPDISPTCRSSRVRTSSW